MSLWAGEVGRSAAAFGYYDAVCVSTPGPVPCDIDGCLKGVRVGSELLKKGWLTSPALFANSSRVRRDGALKLRRRDMDRTLGFDNREGGGNPSHIDVTRHEDGQYTFIVRRINPDGRKDKVFFFFFFFFRKRSEAARPYLSAANDRGAEACGIMPGRSIAGAGEAAEAREARQTWARRRYAGPGFAASGFGEPGKSRDGCVRRSLSPDASERGAVLAWAGRGSPRVRLRRATSRYTLDELSMRRLPVSPLIVQSMNP